jgi:deoxyadenosine/deoxycytidine kinase
MNFKFLAIEGPIGVGKTILAKKLGEKLNSQLILEESINPFLHEFYQNRKGASFKTQLFFLVNRYTQLINFKQTSLFHSTAICDYIIEKDKIFACLHLDNQELSIYNKLYNLLVKELPQPDVVIYLQAKPDVLLHRIKRRNLTYEKNISEDYLKEVIQAFDYFFFHYKTTPLLVINTNQIDFVLNEEHFNEILKAIDTMRAGTQYYTPWLGGGTES